MSTLAAYLRISGVTVIDADVESRGAAVISLTNSWRKEKNSLNLVAKASEVAEALGGDGTPSSNLGNEIQAAIQKKSPSFLYEERPLDVGVCAGMAMVSILSATPGDSGWSNLDVYAASLWSALAFQPPLEAGRRENLRLDVFNIAAAWSAKSAEKARERIAVPDPKDLIITLDAEKGVANDFGAAIANTVEALRRNAALDREELDFLWWAQLQRSRLLKKQLFRLGEPTRIVAAGIEGARLLRRLPCDVHRELVLRTLDQDPELDLSELLTVIGDDRIPLCAEINPANATAYPSVFPLVHALVTGQASGSGASLKRRVSEWGERALLEATLIRFISLGVGKI